MTLRMPRGLARDGRGQRLWKTVTTEFELDGEPHKAEILAQACRVTDLIAELERAAATEPLTSRGSAQQLQIHPLISEVRFQRGLLAQLLGRLGLPDTDEAIDDKAHKLSRTRSTAAKGRLRAVQ